MTIFKGRTLWRFLPVVLMIIMFSGCVKPQYKTAAGKRKNKKYNSVQYAKPPGKVNNARNTGKH